MKLRMKNAELRMAGGRFHASFTLSPCQKGRATDE
jgi:hypothetical protein